MLFKEKDIARILEEVDLNTVRLVARVLGKRFLTRYDLELLKKRGVDLAKLLPKFPSHYQSYLFGKLSGAMGDSLSRTITYPEFTAFLAKTPEFLPTIAEMAFYDVAASKTYGHIKGLGDKIKNDLKASINAEELAYLQAEQAAKTQQVIKDEILEGTYAKKSVKKISANIANQMQDWNRDWGRIVETECQDIFNLGRTQAFMQDDPDPMVYFQVYPGACRHCIRLYLTKGVGSQPRLFKLSQLLANGTNYGVKSAEWKPTVHPVHPFCRCNMEKLPKGYVWNDETHRFEPPKDYAPKVERKSRVKITIGDKKYEV